MPRVPVSGIASIHARQILDSRGNPTVEVEVILESGARGLAAVPSGASTGEFEAVELRDGGDAWAGKGVSARSPTSTARSPRRCRAPTPTTRRALDAKMIELDGTPNKGRLGANAILGVSLAAAKAAAMLAGEPLFRYLAKLYGGEEPTLLPVPMMNVLNGGAHADNSVDFQEFMVVPAGATSFSECLRVGTEVFHALKKSLAAAGHATAVGDEGGFAPNLESNEAALQAVLAGVEAAGYEPGKDVFIALDPATSEVFEDGAYVLEHEGRSLSPEEMAGYWEDACSRYPILSIEDGMDEEDWDGWKLLTEKLGERVQLVGDDLFVTNPERLNAASSSASATRSWSRSTRSAPSARPWRRSGWPREAGYTAVISHRSGETEDTTIADLAVATGAGQIKTGAPSRSDRVAKYNRLLRIEEELGLRGTIPRLAGVPPTVRLVKECGARPRRTGHGSTRSGEETLLRHCQTPPGDSQTRPAQTSARRKPAARRGASRSTGIASAAWR